MKPNSFETDTAFDNFRFPVNCEKLSFQAGESLFPPHFHEHFELLYIVGGSANIRGIRDHVMNAGDTAVFNPKVMHTGTAITDVDYYYFMLGKVFFSEMKDGVCNEKYINGIFLNQTIFHESLHDGGLLPYLEKTASLLRDQPPGYELLISSQVYALVYQLLTCHVNTAINAEQYDTQIKNTYRMLDVLEYINDHYTEKISLEDIADHININKYYLSHIFKEFYKKSIWEYITQARLSHAEKLLRSSNLSITEIAFQVGFEDSNYFTRIYKKYKAVSPSRIRKTAQMPHEK